MKTAASEYHDSLASDWEAKYSRSRNFQARQQGFEECLGDHAISGTWLDAGCGTGTLSRWLAEKGAVVEAVDLASKMTAIAERLNSEHPNSERLRSPKVAPLESLPFENTAFDGILCSSVLEYVESPSAVLAEFRRVLKPNGLLLISVPNRRSLVRRLLELAFRVTRLTGKPWPDYLEFSKHRYDAKEFSAVLAASGFELVTLCSFGASVPGLKATSFGPSLLGFLARKAKTA